MLRNIFSNRFFIGVLVVLICAVAGIYFLRTDLPDEPIVIVKPVEPLPKSEVKAPVGDTSQGGHFHSDGTGHEGQHEMPSDENFFESDTEFKARVEKKVAELAAAKTAREQNEALMRYMEASPDFHGQENYYNFLKAHPDFDYATASPELKQKCRDALNADTAKIRAEAEQFEKETAEYERNRKHVDKSPWIPPQGGNR